MQQAILSTCDNAISVHDLQTSSTLATFKPTQSAHPNTLSMSHVAYPSLLLAAQSDKAMIHAFSWQKDQPISKFTAPEQLTCLEQSPRGTYCAAASATGKLYVWEVRTGNLCACIDAHYKRVNAIRFTQDEQAFLTASDDATILVYWTADVVQQDSVPKPHHVWSDHTLAVTDIQLSFASNYAQARVVSCSMDRTCKVWDLARGELLQTLLFPTPIQCITLNAAFTTLFAAAHGTLDGTVYRVHMYPNDASTATMHHMVRGIGISDASQHDQGSVFKGSSGVGGTGHTGAVVSMSVNVEGSRLLTGGQDGKVCVWDVASRQLIKTITVGKGSVCNVHAILMNGLDVGMRGLSKEATQAFLPAIKPFKKTLMSTVETTEKEGWTRIGNHTLDNASVQSIAPAFSASSPEAQQQAQRRAHELDQLKHAYAALRQVATHQYDVKVSAFLNNRKAQ